MHRTTGDNFTLDSQGRRVFTAGPPPTTLDEGWANAVQEEIARAIEASGQTLASGPESDLMNQLATAIQRAAAYDAIISSQETFNAIWERTGANAYKIIDGIGAVYFKAYAGGYNMSGPSSPLSGGDTWGKFETNDATFIMCDGGNFFQMGDTPSYWEISTSNTVVYNMDVRGIGSNPAAIEKSIYIPGTAENCKIIFAAVNNRLTNTTHSILYDASNTATIVGSSINNCENTGVGETVVGFRDFDVAIGCRISNINTVGSFNGFNGGGGTFRNISGCSVSDIEGTSSVIGFTSVDSVSGCSSSGLISSGGAAIGFSSVTSISGTTAINISSSGGIAEGYFQCGDISGCKADTISSSANNAYGFYNCDNVTGCEAKTIKYTGTSSSYSARGFSNCSQLSGCTADDINATGANGYAYGFHTCARMSACLANDVTGVTGSRAYGYYTCTHMDGSCEATAIDDFDFHACSNSPFKGGANASTPYGFEEIWEYTSHTIAIGGGVGDTVVRPKDGIYFGYARESLGSYLDIRIGSSVKSVDISIHNNNYAQRNAFCFPCPAGVSVYFSADVRVVPASLRFMPFGTTT